jgi:hypothetical protein
LPDARCVSLPNPAVAASACTNIYNSTACTQRACYTRRVRWRRSAPRMRPTLLFWPASTYSSSFAAPATLHCLPPPDHVLPFITASHHLAPPPLVTRPAPAAGCTLNQSHRLSSCGHATSTQPSENARRCSFVLPSLSSASCAAMGHAAAAHVATKGKFQRSGAVCADDASTLSSSGSTASCVDLQVQQQAEQHSRIDRAFA